MLQYTLNIYIYTMLSTHLEKIHIFELWNVAALILYDYSKTSGMTKQKARDNCESVQ